MTLMEGDVILTGTPEGVGPVRVGQKITAGVTDLIDVEFDVQRRNRSFSTWCNKQESNGEYKAQSSTVNRFPGPGAIADSCWALFLI